MTLEYFETNWIYASTWDLMGVHLRVLRMLADITAIIFKISWELRKIPEKWMKTKLLSSRKIQRSVGQVASLRPMGRW